MAGGGLAVARLGHGHIKNNNNNNNPVLVVVAGRDYYRGTGNLSISSTPTKSADETPP